MNFLCLIHEDYEYKKNIPAKYPCLIKINEISFLSINL